MKEDGRRGGKREKVWNKGRRWEKKKRREREWVESKGGEREGRLEANIPHDTRLLQSLVTYLGRGSSQFSKCNCSCRRKVTQLQGSCLVSYSGHCSLCSCYHLITWLEKRHS